MHAELHAHAAAVGAANFGVARHIAARDRGAPLLARQERAAFNVVIGVGPAHLARPVTRELSHRAVDVNDPALVVTERHRVLRALERGRKKTRPSGGHVLTLRPPRTRDITR